MLSFSKKIPTVVQIIFGVNVLFEKPIFIIFVALFKTFGMQKDGMTIHNYKYMF